MANLRAAVGRGGSYSMKDGGDREQTDAGMNFKQGKPYQNSLVGTQVPKGTQFQLCSYSFCEQQQETGSTGEPNSMAKIHG